jgi:hypothetical protein
VGKEKDGYQLDCGVKNQEVLHTVKEERNIPHTMKEGRNINWIGYILRRNCLINHVIEGKKEG